MHRIIQANKVQSGPDPLLFQVPHEKFGLQIADQIILGTSLSQGGRTMRSADGGNSWSIIGPLTWQLREIEFVKTPLNSDESIYPFEDKKSTTVGYELDETINVN